MHVFMCVHRETQEKLHSELPKLIVTFCGCCLMEILQKMALEGQDLSVGYTTCGVPSPKLRRQFFMFCVVGQQCYLFIRVCASNSFAFLVISNTINVPAHLLSFYSQIRSYIYIYKNIRVYMCIMYITVLLWSVSL
jgi:hypothetical protein